MNSGGAFSIRGAMEADLARLLPVVREFYHHFGFVWDETRKEVLLRRMIGEPGLGQIWIAESNGDVAGYGLVALYFSLEFDGPAAFLDELYVSPRYRGSGVGEQLVMDASQALVNQGVRVLRLEVDRRHPEAARLYARLGFVADGRESWTKRLPSRASLTGGPASA